uniref:Uncharacterized protein n=1 Tax=Arundo donax TaxID=35708 RepID=A0A0A9HSA1_ARUDO
MGRPAAHPSSLPGLPIDFSFESSSLRNSPGPDAPVAREQVSAAGWAAATLASSYRVYPHSPGELCADSVTILRPCTPDGAARACRANQGAKQEGRANPAGVGADRPAWTIGKPR